MAVFMNHLGTAPTSVQLPVDAAPGSVDLGAGIVVRQSQDCVAENFPGAPLIVWGEQAALHQLWFRPVLSP